MKKKVCMFVWNHFTNDARVMRECTALVENGYDVKLVAIHNNKDKKLKKSEEIYGFEIIRVDRWPKLIVFYQNFRRNWKKEIRSVKNILLLPFIMLLGMFLMVAKKIKLIKFWVILNIGIQMIKEGLSEDFDIYHSNDLNTLPQGWICSKLLNKNKKLIYDSHEVQTSRTGYVGKKYHYLEKFLVNKIDVMIMTTKTRAEYTENLYNNKVKVIHNYPFYSVGNQEQKINLHSELNIDRNEPILLYQGGIQEGRGLINILEAVPYFKAGITVFIGDGEIKPLLLQKVKELKIEDRVRFLDKVPAEDLKYYTKNAYLGFQVLENVCFNHYSALSNKLFEYMMAEVPIVACDFPEIKKVVEEENIGICVDSNDPQKISRAVNELLNDKKQWEDMKKNCTISREKYNWNMEKVNFTKIYDGL